MVYVLKQGIIATIVSTLMFGKIFSHITTLFCGFNIHTNKVLWILFQEMQFAHIFGIPSEYVGTMYTLFVLGYLDTRELVKIYLV
jgi:hypothetical protein